MLSLIAMVPGMFENESTPNACAARESDFQRAWTFMLKIGNSITQTEIVELMTEVRRETVAAAAAVAEIPVLRNEPHRIARNIRNLANMTPEIVAKLANEAVADPTPSKTIKTREDNHGSKEESGEERVRAAGGAARGDRSGEGADHVPRAEVGAPRGAEGSPRVGVAPPPQSDPEVRSAVATPSSSVAEEDDLFDPYLSLPDPIEAWLTMHWPADHNAEDSESLRSLLIEVVDACAKTVSETQPTMVDGGDIRIGRAPVYQPNPYAATAAANVRRLRETLFTRKTGGSDGR